MLEIVDMEESHWKAESSHTIQVLCRVLHVFQSSRTLPVLPRHACTSKSPLWGGVGWGVGGGLVSLIATKFHGWVCFFVFVVDLFFPLNTKLDRFGATPSADQNPECSIQ